MKHDLMYRKIIVLTLAGTAFALFLELSGLLDWGVKLTRRIY